MSTDDFATISKIDIRQDITNRNMSKIYDFFNDNNNDKRLNGWKLKRTCRTHNHILLNLIDNNDIEVLNLYLDCHCKDNVPPNVFVETIMICHAIYKNRTEILDILIDRGFNKYREIIRESTDSIIKYYEFGIERQKLLDKSVPCMLYMCCLCDNMDIFIRYCANDNELSKYKVHLLYHTLHYPNSQILLWSIINFDYCIKSLTIALKVKNIHPVNYKLIRDYFSDNDANIISNHVRDFSFVGVINMLSIFTYTDEQLNNLPEILNKLWSTKRIILNMNLQNMINLFIKNKISIQPIVSNLVITAYVYKDDLFMDFLMKKNIDIKFDDICPHMCEIIMKYVNKSN
jgi:Leucine-rich repeat (LRR) protein